MSGLTERLAHGDRRALSRALTLLSRGQPVDLPAGKTQPARVVALTGAGGVGKSTLTGRLIETARMAGQSVAVLACDPQSPLTGGALLGDRFRMSARAADDGVFIRSLATPGGMGGVAPHLTAMIRLLESFGFDLILIETVGAGQGDVAVRPLADAVVLLLQPHTGDDLQWEKAGVLEVADVVVIHKADMPGAEHVEAQVKAMLALGHRPPPPVLRISSRSGAGVADLWDILSTLPLRRAGAVPDRELLRLAQDWLEERFRQALDAKDPGVLKVLNDFQAGRLPESEAGPCLGRLLAQEPGTDVR
jgi:LAO/AO transport system ATPase